MAKAEQRTFCYIDSPIGPLLAAGGETGLSLLAFPDGPKAKAPHDGWKEDKQAFPLVREQLRAYFEGNLQRFDVRLAPEGTEFQKTVWNALSDIPFGSVMTYGEVARKIGQPAASRAVGAANGANPISIILPCHRLVGASGELIRYGGGIERKKSLLELEGHFVRDLRLVSR